MLHQIRTHLYRYTELHGAERGEQYFWNSYAIYLLDQSILALVDPLEMSAETGAEIESLGQPTHIFLTREWHLRHGETYRDRWGAQIWANEIETDRFDIDLDGSFSEDHTGTHPYTTATYTWRTKTTKLILYPNGSSATAPDGEPTASGKLYDLGADPNEWNNLYHDPGVSSLCDSMTMSLFMHLAHAGSRFPSADQVKRVTG